MDYVQKKGSLFIKGPGINNDRKKNRKMRGCGAERRTNPVQRLHENYPFRGPQNRQAETDRLR